MNGHSPDVLKTSLWEEKLPAGCRNYRKNRMVPKADPVSVTVDVYFEFPLFCAVGDSS